jgi:hypothetical protein
MLQADERIDSEMLQLPNLEDRRRRSAVATIVLLAVCSLTVSVTTRYSFSGGSPGLSAGTVKTVQRQVSPEPSRQRMTNNAAHWMPPTIRSVVLHAPSSYPRVAPAGPPIPGLVFEESLYNRPPPSSEFLS